MYSIYKNVRVYETVYEEVYFFILKKVVMINLLKSGS